MDLLPGFGRIYPQFGVVGVIDAEPKVGIISKYIKFFMIDKVQYLTAEFSRV